MFPTVIGSYFDKENITSVFTLKMLGSIVNVATIGLQVKCHYQNIIHMKLGKLSSPKTLSFLEIKNNGHTICNGWIVIFHQ